ncbi:MAG: histidinol-phosphate transaminase [Gammaproteobacteria bacterium]|nr:histidinol-phosphate transaminase [Gammaproteobacteria bacterium]
MTYQRRNIEEMTGYAWGEQPADPAVIKLNTNENPHPPSPAVDEALKNLTAADLRTYPQPTADALRDRLADFHSVKRENIVITHGGDEALRLAFTTFVEPGTPFGMADPSYSLYPVLASIQGASIHEIPLHDNWDLPRDFAHELNEAGANLACLVNPHAPSGVLLDAKRISQLANDFNGVLLIDEAYVDFVDPALRYDVIRLVDAFENLLVLRTFSKGYSLAGLRLGYLVGSKSLLDPLLTKTRDSYNIDHISQLLGVAALSDQTYAEEIWAQVRADRRVLREGLVSQGFSVAASQTNFLLAEMPLSSDCTAKEVYEALKAHGVLVRYLDTPLLADKLRITVGTTEQNQTLITWLGDILSRSAARPGSTS